MVLLPCLRRAVAALQGDQFRGRRRPRSALARLKDRRRRRLRHAGGRHLSGGTATLLGVVAVVIWLRSPASRGRRVRGLPRGGGGIVEARGLPGGCRARAANLSLGHPALAPGGQEIAGARVLVGALHRGEGQPRPDGGDPPEGRRRGGDGRPRLGLLRTRRPPPLGGTGRRGRRRAPRPAGVLRRPWREGSRAPAWLEADVADSGVARRRHARRRGRHLAGVVQQEPPPSAAHREPPPVLVGRDHAPAEARRAPGGDLPGPRVRHSDGVVLCAHREERAAVPWAEAEPCDGALMKLEPRLEDAGGDVVQERAAVLSRHGQHGGVHGGAGEPELGDAVGGRQVHRLQAVLGVVKEDVARGA
mmetsp:Transcript_40411/g.96028  ORF Transcript_40411/g.96028 Transcript_40411/m.96028 type:complete len:361 (-) Transcript_40411:1163-2245(-)